MSYPYQGYPAGPGYPPAAGGMPQPAPAPAGLPYAAQPYPNQAGAAYPPTTGAYPPSGAYPPTGGYPQTGGFPQGGSYPPQGGSYPPQGGMPIPGESPYPTGAPFQQPPGGQAAPSSAAPYPGGNASGPPMAGGAPYPTSGGAPYPPSGGMPHPSAGPPQQSTGPPYQPTNTPGRPAAPPQTTPYQSGTSAYQPTSSNVPSSGGAGMPSSSMSSTSSGKPAKPAHGSDPNATSYYLIAKEPGDSGTIQPLQSGFNPEADATQIKGCLKGASFNETILVNILPHRSNAQRQKIRLMYKTMYGKDLLQDLRDRLSGDFESVTAALLMAPDEYDAYQINKAIQGAGTDEDVLIQTLCTRSNAQMTELCKRYKETYKCTIEQDIKDDTSGHFRRMLISLANGARQEDQGVNQQKAEEDAKKLYKAGAGRLGTDESTFNSIFVSQSFQQLRAVFNAYKRLYNKDMEKVIKSEMSGDLESGMKTIVRFTLDKHSYYANVLYKAMKGLGTDEKTLIRTLVSRSEIDLEQIKRAFSSIKGESKPLAHWIKKETSGPFRDMLIHIIGS